MQDKRFATIKDFKVLYDIEKRVFGTLAESESDFRQQISNQEKYLTVVFLSPQDLTTVVGYLVLERMKGENVRLFNIAVSPKFQGQGWGTKMMDFIVGVSRNEGADKMVLEVSVYNAAGIALYHKFGFIKKQHLPNYYGKGHDGMRLILDFNK